MSSLNCSPIGLPLQTVTTSLQYKTSLIMEENKLKWIISSFLNFSKELSQHRNGTPKLPQECPIGECSSKSHGQLLELFVFGQKLSSYQISRIQLTALAVVGLGILGSLHQRARSSLMNSNLCKKWAALYWKYS